MDVLTYQCPQCGAPLKFNEKTQRWDCEYCLGSFDLSVLEKEEAAKEAQSSPAPEAEAAQPEGDMREYVCPQCGAHIVTDATTAATFCVFCQNATIFPEQLSGPFRPEKLIPFQVKKETAQEAFKRLCRWKPLLPRDFCAPDRIEKITGVYVPFWLYDCVANSYLTANAQRVHSWSDSRYRYTRTDHFHIERGGVMQFQRIPADGSSKMDDALMDSIEPYDYSDLKPFSTAYLPGFLADKYDVSVDECRERADTRCMGSLQTALRNSVKGYDTCFARGKDASIQAGKVHYAMLPVWVLNTKWQDKDFLFAMNGQTGKLVGDLPVDRGRFWALFAAIAAPLSVLGSLLVMLMR